MSKRKRGEQFKHKNNIRRITIPGKGKAAFFDQHKRTVPWEKGNRGYEKA